MLQSGPDPNAVFTVDQWAEIARSIKRDGIPPKEKQEICDALFDHALSNLKPEELGRFVETVRQFRAAASRIQDFLQELAIHDKIEALIEDIYEVQKFIDAEFSRRPKPKGGRPPSQARDDLVGRLAPIYQRLTGNKPGRSINPATHELTGPFVRFLTTIFRLSRIGTAGLKQAIAKVSRNAKNRP